MLTHSKASDDLDGSGFLPEGTMAEGGAEGLCGFVEGHPGDDPIRAHRAEGGWKHPHHLQGATSVVLVDYRAEVKVILYSVELQDRGEDRAAHPGEDCGAAGEGG